MGLSNFPNGFKDGVTINNVPLTLTNPGEVFFVSNADVLLDKNQSVAGVDQAGGGTFQRPFRTLDFAVGQCTASRGDIIVLMPGHEETLSSATALAMDVAGVTVLGLGTGSLQPKFILDTATTTTIAVSAANVTFKNVKFSANFADIAELFTPTAVNLVCEDCVFTQEATNMNFVEILDTGTTDNQCDGVKFISCEWVEPDTATTSLCNIDADLDGLVVRDCYFNLGVNTSDLPIIAVVATGKDVTNVEITGNKCIRLNDANPLLLTADTTTANTGIVANNYVRHLDTATELLVTAGTNFGFFENKATAAVDASGFLLPAADS